MLKIRSKINILIFNAVLPVLSLEALDAQIRRESRSLDFKDGIKVSRSDNKLNQLITEVGIEVHNLQLASPTASEELNLYLSNQRALNCAVGSESKSFMEANSSEGLEQAAVIGSILARYVDDNRRHIASLQEQVALIRKPKLNCFQRLLVICCCK